MTILVGLKDSSGAYIATDAAVTAANHLCPTQVPKVVEFETLTIASAGSLRGINVLEAHFTPPLIMWDEDAYKYMIKRFVPALKDSLKAGGILAVVDGVLSGENVYIVAIDGRIFAVGSDFSVLEFPEYLAEGSGYEYAYGSLYSTSKSQMTGVARAEEAICAAAKFDTMCGQEVHSYKVPTLDRAEVYKIFEKAAVAFGPEYTPEQIRQFSFTQTGELILTQEMMDATADEEDEA